ncbi:AMP-binding protein [Marinicrinis sediminis]|uniref:AMP-binding protein n=1 Tax=Marinicrinis sediminis TaxID=1652465 RepID=A0ABW5RCK5_9BACL
MITTVSQHQKLMDRLDHAVQYYPYYRSLSHMMNREMDAEKLLAQFPIMDKNILHVHRAELELPITGTTGESFTSGTTGVPFRCVKSVDEMMKLSLVMYKHREKWGLPVRHRMLLVSNMMTCAPSDCERYLKQMMEQQPHFIQGPASALSAIADYIVSRGKSLRFPSNLQFIQNWGESLHPQQKENIEQVFQRPVVNYYGLEEFWCVAFSNRNGKLEIDEEAVYVEVLDPLTGSQVGDGEMGEIIVTSYYMKSLPFIRYRTGDMGAMVKEKDGQKILDLLPIRYEHIRLREGQLPASVFHDLDKFFTQLSQEFGFKGYQMIQLDYEIFRLCLAPGYGELPLFMIQARVSSFLKYYIHEQVVVEVESVKRIAPHPYTGKVHTFVTQIQP